MPPPTRRVAVILSGCGVHDGTEIHEVVLALTALDRGGAKVLCAAPNIAQPHVVNHFTGEIAAAETRSVLVESARIARGSVVDLASVNVRDFDAAVFPGGYGVTKTLSDYATRGRGAKVQADVARFLLAMHTAKKPMALLCTAPILAARVLSASHPLLTIGRDTAIAADLESWGARHEACDVRGLVVDRDNRIVSSPAYMLATRITEAADGIERAVRAMLEMI